MPINLLKKYPDFLEIEHLQERERTISLKGIFNRDIVNNTHFKFRRKQINPTQKDGELPMETLFNHLTTEVLDKQTKQRSFETERSKRLHWIRHHIEEKKRDNMLIFSTKESRNSRTYIYDRDEKYVIVLEPLREQEEYYLLTAYHLKGGNVRKIENKYKRRLNELL